MKSKRLNFRVYDWQDELIRINADKAGMSLTSYVILSALDRKIVNYDSLKELTTQVKKLGNNVNQLLILARHGKINTVNLTAVQDELSRIYDLVAAELYGR